MELYKIFLEEEVGEDEIMNFNPEELQDMGIDSDSTQRLLQGVEKLKGDREIKRIEEAKEKERKKTLNQFLKKVNCEKFFDVLSKNGFTAESL